jgi:hypothetical protein
MRARFQRRAHGKQSEEPIIVTEHAANRFVLRQSADFTTKKDPKKVVLNIFRHAREIRFKRGFMVDRLINNNFSEVRYYFHSGWIFVCTKGMPRTIVTAERQGHRKLNHDFWYVDENSN